MSPIQNSKGNDPLAEIKAIATQNGWTLDDTGDQVTLLVRGKCTDYRVIFTWIRNLEVFHLACSLEINVPEFRRSEVQQLVSRINEQLWLGHFDLWMEDGTILFRESIQLVGLIISSRQCKAMLGSALDVCERYYPAFKFVIASGSANGALEAYCFDTEGEP